MNTCKCKPSASNAANQQSQAPCCKLPSRLQCVHMMCSCGTPLWDVTEVVLISFTLSAQASAMGCKPDQL